jgi:MoaA/NifB/PqqE/SkfB family radical SAM enzyme
MKPLAAQSAHGRHGHDGTAPATAAAEANASSTAADPLVKVYLEITTDCNLDCKMCLRHAWDEPGGRMTPETFQNVLDGLRDAPSASVVNFGGFGEPTVHPLFPDFLLGVKEAGLRAELVTNGVALEGDLLERLLELELDRLVVSLDGAGPAVDAAFHRDSIESVHANLRNLFRMKIIGGLSRPEVEVQFVATQRNVDQLPALKRLAWKLGFTRILVSNLVPYTPDLAGEVLYQKWTTARRDSLPSVWNPTVDLPRLDPRSEARRALEDLCAVGTRVRVGGNDVVGGAMHCRFVGDGCMAVAPDGRASPCLPLMHHHSYYFREAKRAIRACHFGNVNARSVQDVWNDREYRAFRQRVRNFQFSPCIDCGGCDLRETNEEDCFGNGFPCCGECLWAAGLVQCP